MSLKLYNTLAREKEIFKPIKKGHVSIYSCGPTVYDYAHIGNFRAYIVADILKRYLEYKGYKVKHVMNITDVDDKTIKKAQEENVSLKNVTEKYTNAFFEDLEKLNIKKANLYPKATECINDMTKLISKLIDKKYAYKSEDGSIYYDISKFKNYGKLAHLRLKDLKIGARVKQDEYEKKQANDFALWKGYSEGDGDVFWETKLGKGRPGWHIECSVMSMKYLGECFDIHTGGVDLIFPHHQNEIAQSEALSGKKFVNYWVHNEHLLVDGRKMSKSLGNFYTLRDLLKKNYNSKAIRYLLLSTHYKQKLNFTLDGIESANNAVEKINNFVGKAKEGKDGKGIDKLVDNVKKEFEKSMDEDLNIAEALAAIFDFMREANKVGSGKKVYNIMKKFDKVLGILEEKKDKLSEDIEKLIEEREEARKRKDFANADKIRDELNKRGIILEDTKNGVEWRIKK